MDSRSLRLSARAAESCAMPLTLGRAADFAPGTKRRAARAERRAAKLDCLARLAEFAAEPAELAAERAAAERERADSLRLAEWFRDMGRAAAGAETAAYWAARNRGASHDSALADPVVRGWGREVGDWRGAELRARAAAELA